MKRVGSLLALILAGASVVAFSWALYHLIHTGTCASGGAYVSARPCPAGTGGHILGLIGGIFGGLIGTGIWYASRPADRTGPGLGLVMWILAFALAGGAALVAAIGPGNTGGPGSKAGGIIVAAIFIPMGLAGLFGVASSSRSSRSSSRLNLGAAGSSIMPMGASLRLSDALATGAVPRPPTPRPTPPPAAGGADVLSRLERLAELHGEGALTDAEFEAQKRKLLS